MPAVLIGAFSIIVCVLIFSIVNLVRPHLVDGMLMNEVGKRTEGKVVRVEATNNRHNEQRVMRHHVIYRTADGQNIETSFDTWDFNIYPSANSVSYPGQGESFGVLYLPSFPTAFLILTDDDSSYSRSRECGKILSELEEARIKLEFDPADKNYKQAFEETTKKAVAAKCATSTTEIKTTETRELPARTQ